MTEQRPPYLHAALASASALLLYVLTLAPTTSFWDASEYIATAYIVGLPHPPGNPFFVLLGRVWTLLLEPTGLSVAVRVNLLTATASAAATGFLFLVTHRVLKEWATKGEGGEEGPWALRAPIIGAWLGAILASTAFTVWNQSTVTEKVYAPSMLVIALVSWLTIRWLDRKDEPDSAWLVILAVYLILLGSTNHLMSVLPGPALLAAVFVGKRSLLMDRRFVTRVVAAALVGLSFNLVLPIRSAQQPMINEGEPVCTSAAEAVVSVYTMGMAGCPELSANLTRDQYGKQSVFSDPTSDATTPRPRGIVILAHQFLNYFQYFDWQWGRGLAVSELPGNARLPFALVFLGLGVWGLAVATTRRAYVTYLAILTVTLTAGLVCYLNFRYGYSLQPELVDVSREVRERDYFFVASFHLWGFLAGAGLVAAWRWAAGGSFRGRGLALASPVLLLALVPLVFNWAWASRRGDYAARDWAYDMLQSVEPYGILFTNGDNDTFPLWYLQEVEGVRKDVTVIVVQYLMTDWYPRQLKYHTAPVRQRPFDNAMAAQLYGAPAAAPTRPITTLSDEDMDGVGFAVLPEDYTISIEGRPVRFPAGFQFSRADQLALAIIQDSIDERPVHFASTGSQARAIGLDPFVVRQGLAAKLRLEALEEVPGLVKVSDAVGGEWLDLERSLVLANELFTYRGLRDREIWADRATLNIPWHFYFLYLQMADAVSLEREGDALSVQEEALIDDLLDQADRFLLTAEGGAISAG